MKNLKFLPQSDIQSLYVSYRNCQILVKKTLTIVEKVKKAKYTISGINALKETGSGNITIFFTKKKHIESSHKIIVVPLDDIEIESEIRQKLIYAFLNKKRINLKFDGYNQYNYRNLHLLGKYIEQMHPEALVLNVVCEGVGIDVGCGFRKTNPNAIGVDWIQRGKKGKVGNVKGKISEADVYSKGDNLRMFKSNYLDYVVSRHNLEHYKNPKKTLQEWTRVLKVNGYLGLVVPNTENPNTYEKTHYYEFNLSKLRDLVDDTKKIKILKIEPCLNKWSFYCIGQKLRN